MDLGGLGLGLHSFWGTGGLWPLDWTASPFLIVVNQKGLSVLFLPKISAERVSALKYPFCLSAERLSFGRKALFWQKPALSAGSLCQLGRNNLHDILQKTLDILFRQKLPLSVVSVFLPKELF